jgi:hypothetical protein
MATNPPKGDNHRNGAVKGRVQVFNPKTKLYTKIDTAMHKFIDTKTSGKKFKGVTKI